MTITKRLTSQGLHELAQELNDYQNSLVSKVRQFRERLASKGIIAARANVSQGFGQYITFEKTDSENTSIIVAKEMSQILSEWLRKNDEVVQAYVSPLLMAEFGAGRHAVEWIDSKGNSTETLSDGTHIGRGSFPDQKHAFQDSWWYMDLNHNWQQASGVIPSRPMHNAVIEMILQVEATAREVFGNG